MATQNIFNLTDTWNNVATTFTAIKMNATDTASAAGSALMDLQVGGVSQFKVSKAGAVTAVGVAIPTISSTDTLSNKTLSSPTLSGTVTVSGSIALPVIGANGDDDGILGKAGSTLIWDVTREINGVKVESFDQVEIWTNAGGTLGGGTLVAKFDTGLQIGAPTGGDKGAGTANFAADIYKNDTAFTNPDYVFEHFYRGEIVEFAANDGASEYAGLMPLDALREFTRENLHLPQVPKNGGVGIFERGDYLLRAMEESTLYILALHEQIKNLNQRLKELENDHLDLEIS